MKSEKKQKKLIKIGKKTNGRKIDRTELRTVDRKIATPLFHVTRTDDYCLQPQQKGTVHDGRRSGRERACDC